ncbi:MAG: hypothetical protein KDE19_19075 [Caldilineaceae bacterium]|nr:hypothetical protein [Caldilineaceae bacterium]
MSTLIADIPDELTNRLQPYQEHLPTILEIGLEQFQPDPELPTAAAFSKELDDVVDFLQSSPAPEAVIALRTSKALQAYISELLEKNRNEGFTAVEEGWWKKFEHVEHLVRLAKAKAISRSVV